LSFVQRFCPSMVCKIGIKVSFLDSSVESMSYIVMNSKKIAIIYLCSIWSLGSRITHISARILRWHSLAVGSTQRIVTSFSSASFASSLVFVMIVLVKRYNRYCCSYSSNEEISHRYQAPTSLSLGARSFTIQYIYRQ